MAWTTLTLQVTTPLFNGGAEAVGGGPGYPDDQTGVRAPSIRGAMRFWFRALVGGVTGPDLARLAELERAVFGESARGAPSKRLRAASPVQLRIPEQPLLSRERLPDFLDGDRGQWVIYLLGQGLTKYDKEKITKLTCPFVPAGATFELKLRLPPDDSQQAALALASLWLTCAYGGLGARVRRGFGGLRIVRAEGPLPSPWDDGALLTPDVGYYVNRRSLLGPGPVERPLTVLREQMSEQPWPAGAHPTFPVLRPEAMDAGCSQDKFGDWISLLAATGEKLRRFRATESPGGKRPKVTPEWTAVVTNPDGRAFPVGALGLPVVYRDDYVVNADRDTGAGVDKHRRASPLWLRPVGDPRKREWRLFSYGFLGEFLPTGLDVHVWRGERQGHEVTVTVDDVY
ncbi:MAG: type III-B CRISPR module RAMP protein Cmr1, partial [Streptomycetales bacterium]